MHSDHRIQDKGINVRVLKERERDELILLLYRPKLPLRPWISWNSANRLDFTWFKNHTSPMILVKKKILRKKKKRNSLYDIAAARRQDTRGFEILLDLVRSIIENDPLTRQRLLLSGANLEDADLLDALRRSPQQIEIGYHAILVEKLAY